MQRSVTLFVRHRIDATITDGVSSGPAGTTDVLGPAVSALKEGAATP